MFSLPTGEDMRLYVQEIVTQKKWRFFYGLPTNVASIRILPSGVKQYVWFYPNFGVEPI